MPTSLERFRHVPDSLSTAPARNLILAVLGAAALAWAGVFLLHAWRYAETDDAFVTGHIHLISPQVDGEVKAVPAKENQAVRAGDVLVRIDPLAFDIGVAQARAALAQTEAAAAPRQAAATQADAQQAHARARALQAGAQISQARAQLELAKLTLDRGNRMASDRAVSPSDLDEARASFDVAQATVKAAEANEEGWRAGVTSAEQEAEAAAAQVKAAGAAIDLGRAELRDADRKLSYVALTAPADGRVGNKSVEVGNRVQTGQTLMVLVEPEMWIEANFKETQLARMHPGQDAEVRIDAVPGHVFPARIESVAPASGAQFALLPADNATGNFTKVVQRVSVKVVFVPGATDAVADRIRPGLSAVVAVRVR